MEGGPVSIENARAKKLASEVDSLYRDLVFVPDHRRYAYRDANEEDVKIKLNKLRKQFPSIEERVETIEGILTKSAKLWQWNRDVVIAQQRHADEVRDPVARALLIDLAMANAPLPAGIELHKVKLEDSLLWQIDIEAETVRVARELGVEKTRQDLSPSLPAETVSSKDIWTKALSPNGLRMQGLTQ